MKNEVIEKMAALITAAFGLVAALAWNDTIRAIFIQIFGATGNISAMITYAIIVTLLAVIITLWIGKLSDKFKK